MPLPRALLAALAVLILTDPAAAQGTAAMQEDGLALLPAPYTDPSASLRLLGELIRLNPDRVDLRLAAAREKTTEAFLAPTQPERILLFGEAVELAREALALDSTRADVHYWLAASLGMQADQEGGRTKITLAVEAHRRALRTLEIDSLHGGAHHILGRLHNGAKGLPWYGRLIARGLGLGSILEEASWESAERHLRLAVQRDPEPLVHHIELAKLLVRREQEEEGIRILEALAARTPRYPLDEPYIRQAREMLDGLRS